MQRHIRIKQYNLMTMTIIIELAFTEWLCAPGTMLNTLGALFHLIVITDLAPFY